MKTNLNILILIFLLSLLTPAEATILNKDTYLNEFITVQSNWTAFLIPTKSYNRYIDIAYYRVKEGGVWIPYKQLGNTEHFIPAACLYVVKDELYISNWPTKEDYSLGIITAHVDPTNTIRYMMTFGFSDELNPGDNLEFPSCRYVRSLKEVMEKRVKAEAYEMLKEEFSKHSVIECENDKDKIAETAKEKIKKKYLQLGITINFNFN